jgi:ribosomal-protein-alanine N-acetyltransferase
MIMEFDIYLRALKSEDAVFINELRKNEEMEEKLGSHTKFVSLERDQKWVQDLIMTDNPTVAYAAVCENGSEDIIGYTSISEIDYRNGTCFASGIKIVSPSPRKLYGLQAILLGFKFAFEEMRMARVKAVVLEEHTGSLRLMERGGFKREGLMRNFLYKGGAHKNCWLLAATKEDYVLIKEKHKL